MYDTQNIIVSADRDAFQLINSNTEIMFPKKGITETITLNYGNIKEYYGVMPEQVVDLKSLMGDSSDNIPGVSGIGEKKALQLINEYGTLDAVYENIDKLTGKLKENLLYDKEYAYLSQYLATIVTDEKLEYNLEDFEYTYPFGEEVREFFRRFQFESLLKKSELFEGDAIVECKVDEVIIDSEEKLHELIGLLIKGDEISLYIDNDNFNVYYKKEYKISFVSDLLSQGIALERVLEQIKPILESESVKKIVYDSKVLKHVLNNHKINLRNVSFDCILARYLINALAKSNIDINTMMNECGVETTSLAFALSVIKDKYYEKLEKMGLLPLYNEIEMPLVDVLFDMECEGFKIDNEELSRLEIKYREELVGIEKEIFELIGRKFNLSSPKQLSEVLFDELGINIPSNKKKSTSIEILNEIQDRHPVVPLIIRWRTISKLYSTYIVGFQNIIGSDGKIHTIFNQALTATGRLSSSEPNLQNIPIRTEEGRGLRKMFVPTHKDGFICSADYSQIELRLLASFSGDESMIKAFNNGQDIHRMTASEIFGFPLEMIDDSLRRKAKAINFGIVYGISDFGLSQNIGSTRKEASEYIKLYFAKYPKIEKFMNDNVRSAYENGFSRTMFGRVRMMPELQSSNHNMRTFGERVAMNMPLQGSASDIIKLAMIRIFNVFKQKGLKSKIIVQVHDELVVDVYPGELEEVKEILKTGMEGVANLDVALTVNIESGKTWYDAK
jgi:DNA polymerase-1